MSFIDFLARLLKSTSIVNKTMFTINHQDKSNESYYERLTDIVSSHLTEGEKYRLYIPQGCVPTRSAATLGKILTELIRQPDWHYVRLDKSGDAKNIVWEVLSQGSFYLDDSIGTQPEENHCYLQRVDREATEPSLSPTARKAPRVGYLHHDPPFFTASQSIRHCKLRKRKQHRIPFRYFILAVIGTILFCILLHRLRS